MDATAPVSWSRKRAVSRVRKGAKDAWFFGDRKRVIPLVEVNRLGNRIILQRGKLEIPSNDNWDGPELASEREQVLQQIVISLLDHSVL